MSVFVDFVGTKLGRFINVFCTSFTVCNAYCPISQGNSPLFGHF